MRNNVPRKAAALGRQLWVTYAQDHEKVRCLSRVGRPLNETTVPVIRYRAAQSVLMSAYTYAKLTEEDRRRVDDVVDNNLRRVMAPAVLRRYGTQRWLWGEQAVAMEWPGILPPGLARRLGRSKFPTEFAGDRRGAE